MEIKISTNHPDLQKHIDFLQRAVIEHEKGSLINLPLTPGLISFLFEILEWNPAAVKDDLEKVFDIAMFERDNNCLVTSEDVSALSTQKRLYKAFHLITDLNIL